MASLCLLDVSVYSLLREDIPPAVKYIIPLTMGLMGQNQQRNRYPTGGCASVEETPPMTATHIHLEQRILYEQRSIYSE